MPQTLLRVGTSCKNHGLRQRHFYCFADLVLFLKSLFSRPLFARAYPSSGNGLQHLFTNSVHCLFHFGGKLSKMRSAKWAKSPKRTKMGKAQLETSVQKMTTVTDSTVVTLSVSSRMFSLVMWSLHCCANWHFVVCDCFSPQHDISLNHLSLNCMYTTKVQSSEKLKRNKRQEKQSNRCPVT